MAELSFHFRQTLAWMEGIATMLAYLLSFALGCNTIAEPEMG
jgi:hypothetical protein